MKKEDIKQWCKENNYALINTRNANTSIEPVFKIAEDATGIDDIYKKTQKPEYSFARFLAINFLLKYYAVGVLADMFGIHHSIGHYASRNVAEDDLKYYKPWQQNAITYFREKTEPITKALTNEKETIKREEL